MLHRAYFTRARRAISMLFPDDTLVLARSAGDVLHTRIDTAPASLTKAQLLLSRNAAPLARPRHTRRSCSSPCATPPVSAQLLLSCRFRSAGMAR
jgi:hypothetical protein